MRRPWRPVSGKSSVARPNGAMPGVGLTKKDSWNNHKSERFAELGVAGGPIQATALVTACPRSVPGHCWVAGRMIQRVLRVRVGLNSRTVSKVVWPCVRRDGFNRRMSEVYFMIASSLFTTEAPGIDHAFADGECLPCLQQIRCHLGCVGRQIRRGRMGRIPFHVRGILRAMRGTL